MRRVNLDRNLPNPNKKSFALGSRVVKERILKIKKPRYVLEYPEIPQPGKYVGEAWKMKQTPIPDLKMPDMDISPISPYVELRAAEITLHSTEKRLGKKRKDLEIKTALLNDQWTILTDKEEALKENFKIFNKFLKENLEKRERAQRKLRDDHQTLQNRIADVESVKSRCNERRATFLKMKSEITKLSIYETYLADVVRVSAPEFKDIEEPLMKMELLLLTRAKLQKRQELQLNLLEHAKSDMAIFVRSRISQVMGLHNTLASLRIKYDRLKDHTIQYDYITVDIKKTVSNLLSELLDNKATIQSIYNQICRRNNIIERYKKKDMFDQVVNIGRSIRGLQEAKEVLTRKGSKKKSTGKK